MSPLTLPIPLRDTTAWGSYREAKPIPHRYGRTGGELLQYDDTRTRFVWADHPCAGIDTVQVAGVDYPEFLFVVERDSTKTPITFVLFNEPIPEGAAVFARGRGKVHPVSGVLMETLPAVAWDILANLCGQPVTESQMAAPGRLLRYQVAGSLDSVNQSAQAVLRELAASLGARFAADCPTLFFPWPMASWGRPIVTLDRSLGAAATSETDIETIVNDLTVKFDFQSGEPRGSVRFEAPDSIREYGRRAGIFEAKWTHVRRDAHDLCTRLLKQQARPAYIITVSGIETRLNVGDEVSVGDLPRVACNGPAVVLARAVQPAAGVTDIEIAITTGSPARVVLLQQSTAVEAQSYVSAEVSSVGVDRVFTIREEDGSPITQAAVTVEDTTRYTDTSGKVVFPAYLLPAGEYTLTVITQDGRRLLIPIIVT